MCNSFELSEKIKLLLKASAYVEDYSNHKIDPTFIRILITAFPEFKYSKYAYRAIRGKWSNDFSNISWSETKEGALSACKTIHGGGRTDINVYKAHVTGFNIGELIFLFADIGGLLPKTTIGHASEENEILVIEYRDHYLVDDEDQFKAG